jgi:hypothetical protein
MPPRLLIEVLVEGVRARDPGPRISQVSGQPGVDLRRSPRTTWRKTVNRFPPGSNPIDERARIGRPRARARVVVGRSLASCWRSVIGATYLPRARPDTTGAPSAAASSRGAAPRAASNAEIVSAQCGQVGLGMAPRAARMLNLSLATAAGSGRRHRHRAPRRGGLRHTTRRRGGGAGGRPGYRRQPARRARVRSLRQPLASGAVAATERLAPACGWDGNLRAGSTHRTKPSRTIAALNGRLGGSRSRASRRRRHRVRLGPGTIRESRMRSREGAETSTRPARAAATSGPQRGSISAAPAPRWQACRPLARRTRRSWARSGTSRTCGAHSVTPDARLPNCLGHPSALGCRSAPRCGISTCPREVRCASSRQGWGAACGRHARPGRRHRRNHLWSGNWRGSLGAWLPL